MNIKEEMVNDLDFTMPRVIVTQRLTILENVTAIVMISEKALTVRSGSRYTTVVGENFVIKEIGEGRLIIEGNIRQVEFLQAEDAGQDRRIQD